MFRFSFVPAIVVLLICSGCSSTELVDHWQAEDFTRKQLDNVFVVAVTTNEANRFLFESEIKKGMDSVGINGVASHSVFTNSLPEREDLEFYIENNKIDYVIATKLENVEVENTYVPPQVRTYYIGPYYPSYGAYYSPASTITMAKDAYVDTRSTAVLVTTIFSVESNAPVWVGRSKTFRPEESVVYVAEEVSQAMWRHIAE